MLISFFDISKELYIYDRLYIYDFFFENLDKIFIQI